MANLTIRLFQCLSPEQRLHAAAWMFWITLILGVLCTVFISKSAFERVLMAISWGAITITCIDVFFTADVRVAEDEPDTGGSSTNGI